LTPTSARSLVIVAAVLAAAVPVLSAPPQPPANELHLLNVPYLPQSESLCGGAAVAMVMRYWGTADVYAETFAALVDPEAGGIRGEDLLQALRSRGWTAESFRGDPATVQAHLRARRPVVALIQDRPGRFHYVVVVGWSSRRVIVHDPARAPFRILDEKAFDDDWRQSGYWALVATPPSIAGRDAKAVGAGDPAAIESIGPATRTDAPCGGMVDEGVRLAGTGDTAGARRLFEMAAAGCPDAAGPWREMAGLQVLGSDWPAAAAHARQALARDPGDALAARILATALYLQDDAEGALVAWNRVGEPIIDLIDIVGLERIRYAIASSALGLHPRTPLTPQALRTARRRLAELPAVRAARVKFTPRENGRAQVDASVIEYPLWPGSPVALGAAGLRALTDREVAITIASPSGGGEAWTGSWRWWAHRPRVALGLDAPAPFGGIWGVGFFGERQSYLREGAPFEESRRRAELHVSNWTNQGLRWEGVVAVDRFRDGHLRSGGSALALALTAHQRLAGDRVYLEGRAGSWAGGTSTWTLSLRSEWRSRVANEGAVWIAHGGEDIAGSSAPLALWPGAGTGQGRDALLRAHPLIDDGIIREGAFGRTLAHGGAEWRRWVQLPGKPIRVAPAMFVDTARAYRGLDDVNQPWHTDIGAGLRLAVPGSGVFRIDFAHGLRDGRDALSVGWGR
jgi:predicted double-glycine peptidase